MQSRPLVVFRSVLLWNLALALVLWSLGFAAFLAFTLQMDNDFAVYAKEHHQGTALLANLKTLPAYGLLALGYSLLGFPLLLGRWSRPPAGAPWRRTRRMLRLLAVNLLLFLASSGACALANPAFLDALARIASKLSPGLDLYWMIDWRLREVLAAVLVLLGLRALWTWRQVLTGGRGWPLRPTLFDGSLLVVLALAALLALGGRGAAPRFADPSRPHVFVIASDSLRADRLGCYGHDRDTSPVIDALAREGVRFDSFHVATASTLESWLTLVGSQYPRTHGIRYMFPSKERVAAAARNPDTLPRLLARRGYHTAVSSNWAGNCFGLVDMGFAANRASDVQNFDVFIAEAALMAHLVFPIYFNNRLGEWLYPEVRQITTYLNPDALIGRYEQELDRALEEHRPFFGVLFTSHTHLPYAASWPFNVRWTDPDYRGPNRYQIDFEVDDFIQNGFREDLSAAEIQHIRDLYDGCVTEFDDTVGRVLAMLRSRGLLEDSVVIVTSDHGDDLYEPGTTLGHGTNFFGGDQATRIPVVLKLPEGRAAGTVVRQTTRSVDLAPTLLDVLGIAAPGSYEGISLVPAFARPERPLDLPAFAETCYLFYRKRVRDEEVLSVEAADRTLRIDPSFRNNFVLKERYHQPVIDTKDRMMRTERWKLVWVPGKRGPILHFYDMSADPNQEHDLSGRNLPVMRRMQAALERWWTGDGAGLRWTREDDRPGR